MNPTESTDKKAQRTVRAATYRYIANFLDRLAVALLAISFLHPMASLGTDEESAIDFVVIGIGCSLGALLFLIGVLLARAAARTEQK